MTDTAISIENISKSYHLGVINTGTFRGDMQRWWAKARGLPDPHLKIGEKDHGNRQGETIWALKDINFQVQQGEALGIIGHNGAGKSTLLKILSRVTAPTSGEVKVKGRIASLLEVGTGFHPELTGRENIYLNGAILGMNKAEIARKFDEIVDFSGVEQFIDTPVKRYSSGMYVRLAFAVAAHLEPEILIVDEVLAVGDADFQKKCLGKMQDTAAGGRTVLLVSHNMGSISKLCPTTIWLDKGRVETSGTTPAIIASYLRSGDISATAGETTFPENLQKDAQLRRARVLDREGNVTQKHSCDEPIIIELVFQIHRPTTGLYGQLVLLREDGTPLLVSYSHDLTPNPLDGLSVGIHTIRITIPARILGHGDYSVYLSFARYSGNSIVDIPDIICAFSLDDFGSRRGNDRAGFLSTLLTWDVSPISNGV